MKPYYEQDGICIFHGDCRDILPTLAAGSVDLVLTDPPYAVSIAGSKHVGQPGKGVRSLEFFDGDCDWPRMIGMVVGVIDDALAVLSAAGSLYMWLGHRQFGPVVDALEVKGWSTRFLVWAKSAPPPPAPGSGWPSGAELCVYAYRPGRVWNHRGASTPRSNVLISDSFRHGQPGKVEHPTQKPLAVITPLIIASSCVGDLVVDPFMGSGTVALACKQTGRRFIGIEIEERYCEIAARRLQQSVLPLGA